MQAEAHTIIWGPTLLVTCYAGWHDWRTRRIPNSLTVPAFFMGLAVNWFLWSWQGLLAGLEGAGLALALLLPLVLMRALGAGDWKLMGAVGAFLGSRDLLHVLLASIYVSALMAIVIMIRAKKVKVTLRNLAVLVHGFLRFGLRMNPRISLDNPDALKLPFGVAVALGALICFGASAMHWLR
jgi:prepilin peptidase CpaA